MYIPVCYMYVLLSNDSNTYSEKGQFVPLQLRTFQLHLNDGSLNDFICFETADNQMYGVYHI